MQGTIKGIFSGIIVKIPNIKYKNAHGMRISQTEVFPPRFVRINMSFYSTRYLMKQLLNFEF